MISVTDSAREQLGHLRLEEGHAADSFVRVGVKSGGCSGLSYDLSFDTELSDVDKMIENNGVKVVVDKKSMLFLAGTTLDYQGGLNGQGFTFINPNASRTCGCGESFAI